MLMPAYMFDAAYSPNIGTCRSRGAVAMSHYMTGPYASTSAQPAAILAEGMGVVLNWERMPGALVGATRGAGQAFAKDALTSVSKDCPRDGSVGIYFSVDLSVGNLASTDAAFQGINDILRPAGFKVKTYAEGALIDRLVRSGLVQGKQWLSMSSSFPGFNVHDPNLCMVQMHDAQGNWIGTDVPSTDRNTVLDIRGLDAWWPVGSPYRKPPPAPPVPASSKESDMLSIVWVDWAECKAKKVTWPGYFLSNGLTLGAHLPTHQDVLAWRGVGVKQAPNPITLAHYYALGGK